MIVRRDCWRHHGIGEGQNQPLEAGLNSKERCTESQRLNARLDIFCQGECAVPGVCDCCVDKDRREKGSPRISHSHIDAPDRSVQVLVLVLPHVLVPESEVDQECPEAIAL